MSFKYLESPVEFKLEDVFSCGVKKGKFGDYSIPVVPSEEDATKISDLAEENGAKSSLYGKTMYLKSKVLSDKQKKELLDKGRTNILVYFKVTGAYTQNNVSHLIMKVTKLRKSDKPEEEEDIPED